MRDSAPTAYQTLADESLLDSMRDAVALYAVIDAAQGDATRRWIARSSYHATNLYDGPEAAVLEDVAPHIVTLDRQDDSLTDFIATVREQNGGFVGTSTWLFPELRRHLRRFLRARSPQDGVVLFRFYDPRVLTAFVGASSEDERAALLAPFEKVFVPVEKGHWHQLPPSSPPGVHAAVRVPQATKLFEFRQAHLDAFAEVAHSCFLQRVVQLLRRVHPARLQGVDDEGLRVWCDHELVRARVYGLRAERDVAGWFLLRIGHGEALEQERPWLVAIMGNNAWSGAEKLRRVRRGLHLERRRAGSGG